VTEKTAEKSMPAGFLDEAPPPPVSDTVVLSGGNLILAKVTPDTAIVLHAGKLIAWGKRGEVNMPNDSVGRDLRGKWLTPGTLTDLEASTLPNLGELKIGAVANMLIFNTGPDLAGATGDDLHGVITNGELQIFDESD
jgi:imidazolonepropionase-like amidohydrolase